MLTPDDVHNVAFGRPPIGRRGYNEDQVDSFLDDIEETMRELYARLERYERN
ncbi:DivIVA domain-containing protein [Gordonia sp. PKS22-38]|uniref:Cell wall synthesis protein Wag31 n=1 Tax=Gordonia prachuapensis TaxID=3115651 RepID=A0ABU7MWE4_9ACTN|nr:DivIVA domain-containing protein [Gordonia sp. PKS22-38]